MSKHSGKEIAPLNPGWIKRKVPDEYADDDLKRIILFYVINTPCEDLSSSSIPLTGYGWSKKVWSDDKLRNKLFSVANLKTNETLIFGMRTDDMKSHFEKGRMKKKFHNNLSTEKIVAYKNKYSMFLCICYHIRNALAHGRLTMYEKNNEIIFAFEDGVRTKSGFEVRSRMILKKSTLLKWIDIIEKGTMDDEIYS